MIDREHHLDPIARLGPPRREHRGDVQQRVDLSSAPVQIARRRPHRCQGRQVERRPRKPDHLRAPPFQRRDRRRPDGARGAGDDHRWHDLGVIVSAHDGYPRLLHSGADYIEVDIRRTPRGVIVLAHDPVRRWRRYPTFEELLRALPRGVGLDLDLKERGFELELMERAPEKTVVTPDFRESAEIIKRHHPHIRVSPLDFVTLDQAKANDQTLNSGRPVWIWTVDDPQRM